MRTPKNKNRQLRGHSVRQSSPSPTLFTRTPKNLKREISTNAQKDWLEDTIIWGEDNALPLRIAQAVSESPATTSCLDTVAQFIKGAGFTNKALEKQTINQNGDTLWALHCRLADSCSVFNGFAVNHKYNGALEITNAYEMPFESIRFVKPEQDTVTEIDYIKYNPYFGAAEYKKEFTKTYPLHNPKKLQEQINEMGLNFPGQVYYYGKTSPLYRFYPAPKYWAAKKWIYVDGKIQEFHSENLDNGFFQSVLMNVIGNPNEASDNPKYVVNETNPDTGQTVPRSTKTVGEEFNEMMQDQFSGSQKAGNVMVLWANNADTVAKVQAFPSNTNADLFTALQDLTTKNITIATRVPSILANISEGVSLGSGGSEIQKAIELMQANVIEWQMALEDYYNNVLLPGLGITDKVSIVRYSPISEPPQIDDKIWEFLNDQEKAQWIKANYPDITLNRVEVAPVAPVVAPTDPNAPAPSPAPAPTGNGALKDLSIANLNKIQKIVARFNLSLSDPGNSRALTYEQAKQLLAAFGFTEDEINAWLVTPEELTND